MLMQHAEPTTGDVTTTKADVRAYAWVVFALTVGLLLSDYMSRQVLAALSRARFSGVKCSSSLSFVRSRNIEATR